eukprot:189762-Pyramimonas_sp.AAC.1
MCPRSFAIMFLASRGVYWCIEQPLNSLMFCWPSLAAAFRISESLRLVTCLGAFGHNSMKPIELFCNFPLPVALELKRSKAQSNTTVGAKKVPLTKKTARMTPSGANKGWKCTVHVTGNKPELKASQQYPAKFCHALAAVAAKLFERHFD